MHVKALKTVGSQKQPVSFSPVQAGTNYILPVHELSCTRRCLQCTIVHTKIVYWSKNISKNGPLPDCIKMQVQTNPHCPMSAIVTFNSLFLKQYHVSWSNIGFLCPSYILRFERAPRMFLICLWQSRFRTVDTISRKENYT